MTISSLPPISDKRLPSIDVFRAITMFLMIFVNDLWTLKGIPAWLEHASAQEDGMGLADVVFPAFLFIVGLSIPLGIKARLKVGDDRVALVKHILLRSVALIVMGVFHVNLESYNQAALIPKPIYQIIITLAFFMIWLDYRHVKTTTKNILQIGGVLILIAMAFLYEGGAAIEPMGMKFHWWGILGLIGWTYLIGAVIYLISKDNLIAQITWLIFFLAFCSAYHLKLLGWLSPIRHYVWIIGDGALPVLTMAGIVATILYQRFDSQGRYQKWWITCGLYAVIMLLFGFATRPLWGIHKIAASPSWVAVCVGISLIVFGLLTWLIDVRRKENIFKIIKPAGTSTLTSYLLPYIHYALITITGLTLPLFFRTGIVGIVKCLLYSLVIILITGFLEKRKIRLKL